MSPVPDPQAMTDLVPTFRHHPDPVASLQAQAEDRLLDLEVLLLDHGTARGATSRCGWCWAPPSPGATARPAGCYASTRKAAPRCPAACHARRRLPETVTECVQVDSTDPKRVVKLLEHRCR